MEAVGPLWALGAGDSTNLEVVAWGLGLAKGFKAASQLESAMAA